MSIMALVYSFHTCFDSALLLWKLKQADALDFKKPGIQVSQRQRAGGSRFQSAYLCRRLHLAAST